MLTMPLTALRQCPRAQSGQTLAEYALILALIAVVSLAALGVLGLAISGILGSVADAL